MNLLTLYLKPRLLVILCLGFSSGLPLLLTLSTMSFWFASVGVDKTTIGLFALVGAPYAWKFLWAPVLDSTSIPFLSNIMGHRRSWMLIVQVLLAGAIFWMGHSNPADNLFLTACAALSVAFFSATQDILIDAYRIESLDPSEYAAGGGAEVFGYRLGMIIAGGIALMLSDIYTWKTVYSIMALCMGLGIVTTLLCKEPQSIKCQVDKMLSFSKRARHALIDPFLDFIQKPNWGFILLFILLYRFGDNLIGQMSTVFYKELGFSGTEIGMITKAFGVWMTILGGLLGGVIAFRIGTMKALMVGGIIHILCNGFFILLAIHGHSIGYLYGTVISENLSGGFMAAAFVAYLSQLCNKEFTATQYAWFSSTMAITRVFVQTSSGFLAATFGWIPFFVLASLGAVPSLLILWYLIRSERRGSRTA
ncbi:MAG: AmpG family muropeptide MFS transporter [Alphaproteobacteria bacterium]